MALLLSLIVTLLEFTALMFFFLLGTAALAVAYKEIKRGAVLPSVVLLLMAMAMYTAFYLGMTSLLTTVGVL